MKVFKNGIMLQKYKSRLVFSLNQLTLLLWKSLGVIEYCLVKQRHYFDRHVILSFCILVHTFGEADGVVKQDFQSFKSILLFVNLC